MSEADDIQQAISELRRFCPPVVVNQVLTVIEAYEHLVRTANVVSTPVDTTHVNTTCPVCAERKRAKAQAQSTWRAKKPDTENATETSLGANTD
jgi:hypothetical protein